MSGAQSHPAPVARLEWLGERPGRFSQCRRHPRRGIHGTSGMSRPPREVPGGSLDRRPLPPRGGGLKRSIGTSRHVRRPTPVVVGVSLCFRSSWVSALVVVGVSLCFWFFLLSRHVVKYVVGVSLCFWFFLLSRHVVKYVTSEKNLKLGI
jgi:hypothetical protein